MLTVGLTVPVRRGVGRVRRVRLRREHGIPRRRRAIAWGRRGTVPVLGAVRGVLWVVRLHVGFRVASGSPLALVEIHGPIMEWGRRNRLAVRIIRAVWEAARLAGAHRVREEKDESDSRSGGGKSARREEQPSNTRQARRWFCRQNPEWGPAGARILGDSPRR